MARRARRYLRARGSGAREGYGLLAVKMGSRELHQWIAIPSATQDAALIRAGSVKALPNEIFYVEVENGRT